jgi:hypothetical protein
MAAYCTLTDVEAYLPTITISATGTTPTDAQVSGYITLVTAEIDGVLRSIGIDPQPTDADSLGYLKVTCVVGAAATVLAAKFGQASEEAKEVRTRYQLMLDAIRDGALHIEAASDRMHFGEGFTLNSLGEARAAAVTKETTF